MRINTINSDYVMIETHELTKYAFDYGLPKSEQLKCSRLSIQLHDYSKQIGSNVFEFAVKKSNILDKYIKNIDNSFELNKLQNALIYSIIYDCDNDTKKIIEHLIKSREKISYEEVQETYGKAIADYILRNGDYDVVEDKNLKNEKDKNFILFNDEEIIRISLEKDNHKPILQNSDVK